MYILQRGELKIEYNEHAEKETVEQYAPGVRTTGRRNSVTTTKKSEKPTIEKKRISAFQRARYDLNNQKRNALTTTGIKCAGCDNIFPPERKSLPKFSASPPIASLGRRSVPFE